MTRSPTENYNHQDLLGAISKIGSPAPPDPGKGSRPGPSPFSCLFLLIEKGQYRGCLALIEVLNLDLQSFSNGHSIFILKVARDTVSSRPLTKKVAPHNESDLLYQLNP